mgnify:CR=1 FL=1
MLEVRTTAHFRKWFDSLKDRKARFRIQARIDRVEMGHFGDVEPVGEGVLELRIDWGPGYRVYFARLGQVVILLLLGGDKKTQRRDIKHAKAYFEDYKARAPQKSRRRT